jgi:light-regulated signal transduction histidine kinase (bacteriophytochrome)
VDLSAIAGTISEMLLMEDPQRQVEFVIEPNCIAYADASLLRIVLENLVGNAWKFTSKTPGAKIEFGRTQAEDGEPVFYVRDNGAGFDQQYAQRLFGAFQRLHTTSEFPGTGVGLASVKRIITRHGGKVWIEGQLGAGATAFFTLPKPSEA